MPNELGFYWARIGDTWYLVDWQDRRHKGQLLASQAWIREPVFRHMTSVNIYADKVQEWSARVVEPGKDKS